MFWKKKDGYESYNGGDYIRPTEEYRADCEEYHEHGQTYSDYDSRIHNEEYRADCSDHNHGQTYDNYSVEQKFYDESSRFEKNFAPYLASGEYILWCGRAEKNATAKEKGTGGCLPIVFIALLFFPPLAIFGLIVYAVSAFGVKSRAYAITNQSVLVINKGKVHRVPLRRIKGVTYNTSDRNIGYVTFYDNLSHDDSSGGFSPAANGIFGIKEPGRVATILRKAIADYR